MHTHIDWYAREAHKTQKLADDCYNMLVNRQELWLYQHLTHTDVLAVRHIAIIPLMRRGISTLTCPLYLGNTQWPIHSFKENMHAHARTQKLRVWVNYWQRPQCNPASISPAWPHTAALNTICDMIQATISIVLYMVYTAQGSLSPAGLIYRSCCASSSP